MSGTTGDVPSLIDSLAQPVRIIRISLGDEDNPRPGRALAVRADGWTRNRTALKELASLVRQIRKLSERWTGESARVAKDRVDTAADDVDRIVQGIESLATRLVALGFTFDNACAHVASLEEDLRARLIELLSGTSQHDWDERYRQATELAEQCRTRAAAVADSVNQSVETLETDLTPQPGERRLTPPTTPPSAPPETPPVYEIEPLPPYAPAGPPPLMET
ncbi:MAG: hypothetical protein ACRC35_12545 [Angustibacter sp.]